MYLKMAIMVGHAFGTDNLPTSSEMIDIFCQIGCNSISLYDDGMDEVGVAIYEGTPTMINHNCNPNSFALNNQTRISIKALRPIQPNEQITISYVSTTNPGKLRKKHLLETYFFTCNCLLCQSEENGEDIQRIAGKCLACPATMPLTSPKCPQCQAKTTPNSQLLDVIANYEEDYQNKGEAAVDGVEVTEEALEKFLAPGHFLKGAMLRKWYLVNLDAKDFTKAQHYARLLCAYYQLLLPPLHPMVLLYRYALVKLILVSAPSETPQVELKGEIRELTGLFERIFGSDHPLFKEISTQY